MASSFAGPRRSLAAARSARRCPPRPPTAGWRPASRTGLGPAPAATGGRPRRRRSRSATASAAPGLVQPRRDVEQRHHPQRLGRRDQALLPVRQLSQVGGVGGVEGQAIEPGRRACRACRGDGRTAAPEAGAARVERRGRWVGCRLRGEQVRDHERRPRRRLRPAPGSPPAQRDPCRRRRRRGRRGRSGPSGRGLGAQQRPRSPQAGRGGAAGSRRRPRGAATSRASRRNTSATNRGWAACRPRPVNSSARRRSGPCRRSRAAPRPAPPPSLDRSAGRGLSSGTRSTPGHPAAGPRWTSRSTTAVVACCARSGCGAGQSQHTARCQCAAAVQQHLGGTGAAGDHRRQHSGDVRPGDPQPVTPGALVARPQLQHAAEQRERRAARRWVGRTGGRLVHRGLATTRTT